MGIGENGIDRKMIIKYVSTHIQADPRVEHVLLPLRDGLMVVRKRIEV